MDNLFEKDRKFYELGIEHNKVLLKTMLECIEMADQETFTKRQVITMLKELMR
jgi:hypothetical protein